MARKQSTRIRKDLNRLVPKKRLEALAKETGAVQREKKVQIVPLFWTLVLGFATGKEVSPR